jgi:PTH1 family peptidyl-tRNA hydrolase
MSLQPVKLIAGLGNPGRKYAETRHNAGFAWVEALAAQSKISFKDEAKFSGKTARVSEGTGDLWLVMPQTYMNLSGQAVGALAHFYKIVPGEILVVHDELDLPPGGAKIKFGGGVAGHNGLKDIAAHLGTRDFWRLRIGIGHPGNRDRVADYVLERASRDDQALIDDAIARSLELFPLIAKGDFEAAMLKLHTKKQADDPT